MATLQSDNGQSLNISEQIEARFIEQEHRFVKIAQNYLKHRNLSSDNPIRTSSRNALLWHLFSPTTAALAGGAIVAVASLIVLSVQTSLISQQNEYFREQNRAIQIQIDQQASQERDRRRTEVIASIYALKESPTGGAGLPVADARTRIEAFREFIQLERSRLKNKRSTFSVDGRINLSQVEAANLNLSNQDFRNVDMQGSNLVGTYFANSILSGSDFRASLFERTGFGRAVLNKWNCAKCNLNKSNFSWASLRNANLHLVDVYGVSFFAADLSGADLSDIRNIENAEWHCARVGGVVGLSLLQKEMIIEKGAITSTEDRELQKCISSTARVAPM